MRVIHYLRVSTQRQQLSALGLEAQKAALGQFDRSNGCEVIGEFIEVESGRRNDRPALRQALRLAKLANATVEISRLDRLSRNLGFLVALQESGVRFRAVDMPHATELTVHIMAAVAQAECRAISSRTREALQAARARGQVLGNPNGAAALRAAGRGNAAAVQRIRAMAQSHAQEVIPIIDDIRADGMTSLNAIAREMNRRGIMTARRARWHATSVRNLLSRIA